MRQLRIQIDLQKLRDNAVALGARPRSDEEYEQTLHWLGFERRGNEWTCRSSSLVALDASEVRILEAN